MKLARSVVAIMAIAALAACDDDDDNGTGPGDDIVVADLAGSYQIGSFTYDHDDSNESVNLTPLGMGVTELEVEADGSFTGTLVFPHPSTGEPTPFPIGGDISISNADDDEADLTIAFDAATQALGLLDASETGTVSLSGNTLTLVLTEVTVPQGLPGGGANANLIMVATRS